MLSKNRDIQMFLSTVKLVCVYADTRAAGTTLGHASPGDSDLGTKGKRQTGHGQVPVRHGALNEVGTCLLPPSHLINDIFSWENFMFFGFIFIVMTALTKPVTVGAFNLTEQEEDITFPGYLRL